MEEFTSEELEKARATKREYMRAYRQQPEVKERERVYRMRHWVKKAKELEAQQKANE